MTGARILNTSIRAIGLGRVWVNTKERGANYVTCENPEAKTTVSDWHHRYPNRVRLFDDDIGVLMKDGKKQDAFLLKAGLGRKPIVFDFVANDVEADERRFQAVFNEIEKDMRKNSRSKKKDVGGIGIAAG